MQHGGCDALLGCAGGRLDGCAAGCAGSAAAWHMFCQVQDCRLVVDPRSKESRGFAFVMMETEDDASRAIKYLDRSVLQGRVISVQLVHTHPPRICHRHQRRLSLVSSAGPSVLAFACVCTTPSSSVQLLHGLRTVHAGVGQYWVLGSPFILMDSLSEPQALRLAIPLGLPRAPPFMAGSCLLSTGGNRQLLSPELARCKAAMGCQPPSGASLASARGTPAGSAFHHHLTARPGNSSSC